MTSPNFEFDKQMFWDQMDDDLNSFDSYLKDTDWLQDNKTDNSGLNDPNGEEKRPSSYENEVIKEKFDITEDEIKKISDPKERIEKVKQYYNENPISFNLANSVKKLKKIAQQRREVDVIVEQLEQEIPLYEKIRDEAAREGGTIEEVERYYNMVASIISSVKNLIKAYREREQYGREYKRKVEYACKLEKIADKLYKKGYVKEGNLIKIAQNYYKKLEVYESREGDKERRHSIVTKHLPRGDTLEEEVKEFKDPMEAFKYFSEEIPNIKKQLQEVRELYPDDSSMYYSEGNKDDQTWNNQEH